jgi:predicted CxxxxCH...CXXCH cytochrome family protein
MRPPLALVLAIATAVACAKARPVVTGSERCVTWKDQIGPLFAARCAGCHAAPTPAAGYDTESYNAAISARATLLTVLDPATADATHAAFADLFPAVRDWVVDCKLSYLDSSIHRGGILDPASPDFHGQLIRAEKYDFSVCKRCHGDDLMGGTAGVSCYSCHADGPTACSTCHADIAQSGSHGRHLGGGPLGKTFGCAECHPVPTTYTDPGHIFLADGSLNTAPATVTLGATAALTPSGFTRAGAPTWDQASKTCINVYCHGAVLGDSAASNTAPAWDKPGTGQADCGTCHGLPPNQTNSGTCVACHPAVVDKDRNFVAPDLHINGTVDLADAAAGCTGCHGSAAAGPAPPRALNGDTATSSLGVGAHQAHLHPTDGLAAPVACTECHRVPAEVSSPNHFGGHAPGDDLYPAEVFPADATVGALASSDAAAPAWDRTAGTCAGVYCHGGGAKLATDTTPGLNQAPTWTDVPAAGLDCGSSCHGAPPAFAPHLPTMTRTDCNACHPRTVDPAGLIIISGAPGAETSAHINGVLDVAP